MSIAAEPILRRAVQLKLEATPNPTSFAAAMGALKLL
jgi:hypothetical protein